MMPTFYSEFIVRYINPKLKRNQVIIVIILTILVFRVYYDHSSLFGVSYYIFGGICTYIAITTLIGAVIDIAKDAKAREDENNENIKEE